MGAKPYQLWVCAKSYGTLVTFMQVHPEVAYDATNLLMWAFLVACLAAGWWEAAAVLGGLKALGTGRRAARAD